MIKKTSLGFSQPLIILALLLIGIIIAGSAFYYKESAKPNTSNEKNGVLGLNEDPPEIGDLDGDGVPDDQDMCPEVHQGETPDPQRPGCPLEPEIDTRPVKKWNPGHYIQHKTVVTPQQVAAYFDGKEPRYNALQGVHIRLYWKDLEDQKDVYKMQVIQNYLDALPQDKHAIFLILDRDVQNNDCGAGTRVPSYLKKSKDVDILGDFQKGKFIADGCIVKYWEPDVLDREVALLKKVAETFDDNSKFEAVLLGESTWGRTKKVSSSQTLPAYIQIHEQAGPYYKKSHLVKMINHLGGETTPCDNLRSLTTVIKNLGHGIGNPDTVPWESLPWDCIVPVRLGEKTIDKSKPVYAIYRENQNAMAKFVGNDTSQLGNPGKPRVFNNELMNAQNLVRYQYMTAVSGFDYKTGEFVPGLGANYLFWNTSFWSRDTDKLSLKIRQQNANNYTNAYLDFINEPGHDTNTTCPANIRCEQN